MIVYPERRHSGSKVKGEAVLDGVVKADRIPEAASQLAGQQDGCGGPWMFFVVSAHTYPLIQLPTRSLLWVGPVRPRAHSSDLGAWGVGTC